MNNIIHKIRQIYPVSEEALQALLMNMQVRHYPKGTYIVQADRPFGLFHWGRGHPFRISSRRTRYHHLVQPGRWCNLRNGFTVLSAAVSRKHWNSFGLQNLRHPHRQVKCSLRNIYWYSQLGQNTASERKQRAQSYVCGKAPTASQRAVWTI